MVESNVVRNRFGAVACTEIFRPESEINPVRALFLH